MKTWKKLLYAFLVIFFAAAGFGFYLYNKKPADVRKLSAKYELSAASLVDDFNKDEKAATVKYLEKVIAVTGKVSDVKLDATGQATVFLDSGDPLAGVTCSFYDEEAKSIKGLQKGATVTIKGNCTGKLMDVVLNKCSINK
jgi:tRNA_anti-like